MLDIDALNFQKGNGLVTVVTQDADSGTVLMVAHADREALERTVETREMHYRSRSRGLWRKGETSGNVQRVVSLAPDCDGDAVLARVRPAGPACHTGSETCFGPASRGGDVLATLDATIADRWATRDAGAAEAGAGGVAAGAAGAAPGTSEARGAPPEEHDRSETPNSHHRIDASSSTTTAPKKPSYTHRLLADRNLRLKKLGEESAELITACADGDRGRAVEEAADVIYHVLVALRAAGASLADVRTELARRAGAG